MTVACLFLTFLYCVASCSRLVGSNKLPDHQTYNVNGRPLICLTRNEQDPCPPDTQIEACNRNWTKVRCVPCKSGLRLCDPSISEDEAKCYDPSNFCSGDGDNVVWVTDLPAGGCTFRCVCNEENGYTGTDPQRCDNHNKPCPLYSSRQFSLQQWCIPCPSGYYNPRDDGIDQCVPQTSSNTTTPSHVKPEIVKKPAGPQHIDSSTTLEPKTALSSPAPSENKDESNNGDSMKKSESGSYHTQGIPWIMLGICVLALVLVLIVGLLIYCKCHQNKDGEYSIVQFCNCGSGHFEARNGDQEHYHLQGQATPMVSLAQGYQPEAEEEADDDRNPGQPALGERSGSIGEAAGVENQLDQDTTPHHRRPHEHDEQPHSTPGNGPPGQGHDEQPDVTPGQGHDELPRPDRPRPQEKNEYQPGPMETQVRGGQTGYDKLSEPTSRKHGLPSYESQPPPYNPAGDGHMTGRVQSTHCVVTSDLSPGDRLTLTIESGSPSDHVTRRPEPDDTGHKTNSAAVCEYNSNRLSSSGPQAMQLDQNQIQENTDSSFQRQQLTEPKRKLSDFEAQRLYNKEETDISDPVNGDSERDPMLPW